MYNNNIDCDIENLTQTIVQTNTSFTNEKKEIIHWIIYVYEKCGISILKNLFSQNKINPNNMHIIIGNEEIPVLWSAYAKEYTDLVSLLLDFGADPTQGNGFTVLHWMANENDIDMLKKIKKMDFNINKKDYEYETKDRTALHWTAQGNSIEALEFLIQKGANINELDIDGRTPLHIAVSEGNKKFVAILLKHNPDTTIKDNFGDTALKLSQVYKHKDIEKILNN